MKKFSGSLIILAVTLALTMAACKGKTTETPNPKPVPAKSSAPSNSATAYNVPKTPLSIEPPTGWTKNDTGQFGTYVIFLDKAQDGFSANLNVLSESMAGMAQEDYINLSIEKIKQGIDSCDIKDRKNTTIGGMPATELTYTGNSNNLQLTWNQVFVFYEGSAYIFTGTTLTKSADAYLPIFERTFQTVRVAE